MIAVILEAGQIVCYYVGRWQVEVTCEEVRAHLGVVTQRQWSDKAITRTTPALMGLYSLLTLMARQLLGESKVMAVNRTAWYDKKVATFSDTIDFVREHLWSEGNIFISPCKADSVKIPPSRLKRFTAALYFAP